MCSISSRIQSGRLWDHKDLEWDHKDPEWDHKDPEWDRKDPEWDHKDPEWDHKDHFMETEFVSFVPRPRPLTRKRVW